MINASACVCVSGIVPESMSVCLAECGCWRYLPGPMWLLKAPPWPSVAVEGTSLAQCGCWRHLPGPVWLLKAPPRPSVAVEGNRCHLRLHHHSIDEVQGPVSISDNMLYYKILWRLDVSRLAIGIIVSFLNLTGAWALPPRCLPNIRVMEQF